MVNKTHPNERIEKAQDDVKRRLDSLAPFMPPGDRFPEQKASRWRKSENSIPRLRHAEGCHAKVAGKK